MSDPQLQPDTTIRPAQADDAQTIGALWLRARPEFCAAFQAIPQEALAALGALWTNSERLTEIAVASVEDKAIGMAILTRYPRRNARQRAGQRRQLAHALGRNKAARGLRRLAALGWDKGYGPMKLT